MTSSSSRIDGIYTIGVPVTDQDRAPESTRARSGSRCAATLRCRRWVGAGSRSPRPGAGSPWHLVPATDGKPAGVEVGIRFTAADAAALHSELAGAGVAVDELLTWPGVPPMFRFTDPDGNGMEIVQRG